MEKCRNLTAVVTGLFPVCHPLVPCGPPGQSSRKGAQSPARRLCAGSGRGRRARFGMDIPIIPSIAQKSTARRPKRGFRYQIGKNLRRGTRLSCPALHANGGRH